MSRVLRTIQDAIDDRSHDVDALESSPTSMKEAMLDQTMIETKVDEKKLVRRIDLRVMPMLFLIYVAAFLDR